MALHGIDVSKWQCDIAIDKISCDFVIVKATQGTTYVNPYFEKQVSKTISSGKLLGVYHYASKGGAQNEAKHFLNTVKNYIGKAILVLDWEGDGNDHFGNSDTSTSYAKEFMDYVYKETGVKPLFYISKSVTKYKGMDTIKNAGYKLWAAQYANYNEVTKFKDNPWTDNKGFGPWNSPTIYQYTSRGRLSGYNGNLDFDIAYLTKDEWNNLAKKSSKDDTKPVNNSNQTSSSKYTVKEYNLNFRKDASTTSEIIGLIKSGSQVTAVEEKNGMIKIDGWVSTKYLQDV